jgi:hypothetical protein
MPEAQPELHVFTFGLRPGDRVTRADGDEWDVADPPETYQGGKMVRVRLRKPGDTSVTDVEYWPAYQRVRVKRRRPGSGVVTTKATVSTRTELVIRDGDGKLVYRLTLPCDPVVDPGYLAALVCGPAGRCHRLRAAGERAGPLRQDARRAEGVGRQGSILCVIGTLGAAPWSRGTMSGSRPVMAIGVGNVSAGRLSCLHPLELPRGETSDVDVELVQTRQVAVALKLNLELHLLAPHG